MKLVIIGGNGAGMSAASRAKRKSPETEVIVLEASQEVSYGACGLPYFVAGINNDVDLLRIRSAAQFEESGVCVKLGHEVTALDTKNKTVSGKTANGEVFCESYDKLVVASGSSPRVPPIPGIEQQGIYVLKTIVHAEQIKAAISAQTNVVIVGGGYIGLEIAEACILRKAKSVRLIEATPHLLNTFDPEFGEAVSAELEKHGVTVCRGEAVRSFEGDGKVTGVTTEKGTYAADVVIVAIGVFPNTGFAPKLEKLQNGAIVTDAAMRTSDPDIYAAGDCATVYHAILKAPAYIPLGTNANKQGRLAGDNVFGKEIAFDRALGTSMLRVMDLEFAKTGIGEKEAQAAGIKIKTKTVKTKTHARYYPNPYEITIKLCYREEDNVLVGAQIMGEKESAWRIDVFACAIDQKMTTAQLGYLDLGYAPPFSSVWDAVQVAANAAK